MKKITSFLMMMVLCCIGAYAQAATEFVDKLIKIGAQQTEVVPGKWYFIHTPRNANASVTSSDYADSNDGVIQSKGGLVYDNTSAVMVSATSVIGELTDLAGINSKNYMKHMVRFVAVEGETDVYYIQFGTGNYMADAPGKATVTNNQFINGEAGKYNFYLPAIDGTPNSVGRFAWNKYNMAERVDNNGAGNNVSFWASGEVTQESEGWTTEEEIGGNKIWEIFDIEVVGEVDLYVEAYQALLNYHTSKENEGNGEFVENLRNNKNGIVGTDPGDYREEGVNAFLAYFDKIAELIMNVDMFDGEDPYEEYLKPLYPEPADLEALLEGYEEAYDNMMKDKVARAVTNIVPGYYTITNARAFFTTKTDSIFYTQEEADSVNKENGYFEGDEGYVVAGGLKELASTQVPAPMKSLFAEDSQTADGTKGRWMAWGSRQKNARFLWKIEAVEGKPSEYRLTNMYKGESFKGVGYNSISAFLTVNDTSTTCFDWRGDKQFVTYTDDNGEVVTDSVTVYNIRGSQHAEEGGNYLHPRNHGNGTGNQDWIIGYYDEVPSRWYLTPVSAEEANDWMFGPEAQLRAMIQKGDSIAAAFPAQLKIAKDMKEEVVTDFTQFSSPYSTNDAQSIPSGKNVTYFLIDGNPNTYWHSRWEDGNVEMMMHYLQIDATEELNGDYFIKMTRRPVVNDHPVQMVVLGYNENNTSLGVDDGVELATLDMPLGSNTETINSDTFKIEGYRYIRLYVAETAGTNGPSANDNRGYWHASELNIFNANPSKRYEKSQYDARKAEADALSAAIAVWEDKAFAADSLELLEDESFIAAYNAIVAAGEAWGKVFVDPAALREAIATVPAENLFVTGNNPGQWKEGVVTPAATAAAAEAYNASGAYTPAESEAHIAAIAKAEADVWAAANKVKTGKWYRFSFASEEMYDEFKWSKTPAQEVENETTGDIEYPELFGKVIAAGKQSIEYSPYTTDEGEEDTLALYSVEEAEEICEGNRLFFFDSEDADFENGEDLFQFIPATDSSYIIQNKATGLFLRASSPAILSAVPSYFDVKAIGTGANLIGYTDVLGKTDGANIYLHGERSTNLLTKWQDNYLGSNSMMFIEEVEAVTEEPATEYTHKLWPGKVYTYTYPVDVTVTEGATAYGAELVVSEEDTTVVLKAFAENKVAKGLPFILIADLEGEYVTTADRLIEILQDYENWGYVEKQEANEIMDEEYVRVKMNHGMEVDTLVKTTLSMRGTLKSVTVEGGKGILAKENGFEHIISGKTVGAYSAWIACDFDPESADVLGSIAIKVEGEIESGINEVLNKVAQSGKIYNAAGQLVGKGNINTVNSLPAGIYVVNGVKVIKK